MLHCSPVVLPKILSSKKKCFLIQVNVLIILLAQTQLSSAQLSTVFCQLSSAQLSTVICQLSSAQLSSAPQPGPGLICSPNRQQTTDNRQQTTIHLAKHQNCHF